RVERHVGEQLFAGLIAFGDGQQVIQITLAARVIIKGSLQNGAIEFLDDRNLGARLAIFGERQQQPGHLAERLFVARFRGKLRELLKERVFGAGGAKLAALDVEEVENLLHSGVADVVYELE